MSFQDGLVTALGAGEIWNSQRNPPKVYWDKRRVHHYEAGVVIFLVGVLLRSPTLAGFGTGLFLHDLDDVRW